MPFGPAPTWTSRLAGMVPTSLGAKLVPGPVGVVTREGRTATLLLSRLTTNSQEPVGSIATAAGPWIEALDSRRSIEMRRVLGGTSWFGSFGGLHRFGSWVFGSPDSTSKVVR